MSFFVGSESNGEYCATCLRVLGGTVLLLVISNSRLNDKRLELHSLIRNSIQGTFIVKSKVAGVNDVISTRLLSKLIERSQIA